jgi:hypothetical protein
VSDGRDVTPPDPDSDGCLCVVVSFVGAAGAIEEVTHAAAKRVMMSPLLSDFVEFRFADLGPQPGHGGDRSAAVRRVTNALLNPRGIAGRNYFALVVVDRSAAAAEQVLGDCAASPFLGQLGMRPLGIANADDRPGREPARQAGTPPEIMTSPTGVWSRKEDLVDVLRRFAIQLQRDFSARHKPGLSAGELADLRQSYHEYLAKRAAAGSPAPGAEASGTAASPGIDLLAGDPEAPKSKPEEAPETGEEAPGDHLEPSGPSAVSVHSEPSGPSEAGGPASRARRWIPRLIKRQAEAGAAEPQDNAEDAAPKTEGLVYLLVVGDESCRDEAALNRSRHALLEVDRKIADLPGLAYRVRMLHGDEDGLRGGLREAGQLGRRDIKRTVASTDFAAVLEGVRASLRRDRVALEADDATTRPAVVFFTPEPPLADTVAVELFRDLAQEASIIWALPRNSEALLSGAFAGAPGVRVITDNLATADEITAVLGSGTSTVKTQT